MHNVYGGVERERYGRVCGGGDWHGMGGMVEPWVQAFHRLDELHPSLQIQ